MQCIAHERAQKQLSQAVISKQQIMLRQSLVQNAELKNRLAQIQALTAGVDTPHVSAPVPIKTPQPRTPAHTKAFGRSSNSSLPHYSGKTLTRFDSFVSVQSTEFFDALDDVRELMFYTFMKYLCNGQMHAIECCTGRVPTVHVAVFHMQTCTCTSDRILVYTNILKCAR